MSYDLSFLVREGDEAPSADGSLLRPRTASSAASVGARGSERESAAEPGKFRLAEVEPGVTDELRLPHNIDALADTKASERRFDHR